jgi:hypothetical protein
LVPKFFTLSKQTDFAAKPKDYHGGAETRFSGAATKPEATPKPKLQPRGHGGRTEGTEKHNNEEATGKLVRKSRKGTSMMKIHRSSNFDHRDQYK